MSYSVMMIDPESCDTLEERTVTYNYQPILTAPEVFGVDGIWRLRDMTGLESFPILKAAVESLKKFEPMEDLWMCNPGNVKYALQELTSWAMMYPKGIWEVL